MMRPIALTLINEHATAFGGNGKTPQLKVMQKLEDNTGFATWIDAQLSQFAHLVRLQELRKTTFSAIEKKLVQRRQENAVLLS